MMDKIKIWLISGVMVAIIMAGLIYLRGGIPGVTEKSPASVNDEQKESQESTGKSAIDVQEKGADETGALTSALQSGDISECNKISSNEALKKQCEDNLNYPIILKSGNEHACDQLNDEALKITCYNRVYLTLAVDKTDITLCEKISDNSIRQMCSDQVQMILGRFAKTAQDCSVIVSKALRQKCEDRFFLNSSLTSLKTESCNQISNPELADQCKRTVVKNKDVIAQSKKAAENASVNKTLQEILLLCDNLSGNRGVACKDAIYPQLAFEKKDVSHCDKISTTTKINDCKKEQGDKINTYYLRESIALNDKTLCGRISDNGLKELCQNS